MASQNKKRFWRFVLLLEMEGFVGGRAFARDRPRKMLRSCYMLHAAGRANDGVSLVVGERNRRIPEVVPGTQLRWSLGFAGSVITEPLGDDLVSGADRLADPGSHALPLMLRERSAYLTEWSKNIISYKHFLYKYALFSYSYDVDRGARVG